MAAGIDGAPVVGVGVPPVESTTPGEDPPVPAPDFTLYWSTLDMYESCNQRFLWSKGWEGIDVGGGVGRKKPVPVKDSRHHALMGIVIQGVIEDMYNQEWWKHARGLVTRMLEATDARFKFEVERQYIDWRLSPPKAELLQVCRDGVYGYMKTMHANRLLGPYAVAEFDLLGYVDGDNPVGGRADVILRREDTGTSILDGKNSKEKGKYTDPDQLRWYALCHYLAYGRLPDRLGFIYYRFPHDAEKGESGVDWVPFTKEDVRGLAGRAVDARKKMKKQHFDANPSLSNCRFCEYETVCGARIAQKAANAKNRGKGADKTPDTMGGFVDLDFGGGVSPAKGG